jgi:hypothetical protein
LDQEATRQQIEQIGTALAKLKELTAADPGRRQAVAQFEPAFQRLAQSLKREGEGTRLDEGLGRAKAASNSVVNTIVEVRDPVSLSVAAIVSNGNILKVDRDRGTVLLSRGSQDGVQVDQLYRAYRGGNQTGWLKVLHVEPQWSVARIVQDFAPRAPLQANDLIQLHDEKIDLPEGGGSNHPRRVN